MCVHGPNHVGKSCANGSNIVALLFSDDGTKEMLGVFGSKFWPVSNFVWWLPTSCSRVCKWTQHVTSNIVVRLFARGLFNWVLSIKILWTKNHWINIVKIKLKKLLTTWAIPLKKVMVVEPSQLQHPFSGKHCQIDSETFQNFLYLLLRKNLFI